MRSGDIAMLDAGLGHAISTSVRYLLILIPLMLAAETPEAAIAKAEANWSKAVIKRDIAALNEIYTPDLIYAHSTGNLESREQYLERLKGGKQRYDTMTYEKTRTLVHGNSVVAHSIVRFTGQNDVGAFNDHLMLMHVWIKSGKTWRLVAHQTTRIP